MATTPSTAPAAHIKKVVIQGFGDENQLAIVEADLAQPSAREVQVAVEYSVVCGSDVNMRRGTYPFQRKAPLTPGYSIVGRVQQNGAGSTRFKAGDRVACLTKYDGHAERANLPEKYLVPVPEGIDPKAAVALILDWVTAYEMLHRAAHVRAGQRIFVHGLSGAVGSALIALAQLEGVRVLGTASPRKHAELQKLGAVPFDYGDKKWIAAVQAQGGVDAVFDPLGFQSFEESYAIVKRGGLLVGYGLNLPGLSKTRRPPVAPVMLRLYAKNLLFWRGKRTTFFFVSRKSKYFAPDLERLFALLGARKISVPIKATYPLEQIREAHREYASSAGVGSIVLQIA